MHFYRHNRRPRLLYSRAVIKGKLGYDDSLDAFGVHGVGGSWAPFLTGNLCEKAVNAQAQMV